MKAYQLKIQIKNSHPPIWRRVIVPSGITFQELAEILNITMGWIGYHMHCFEFSRLGISVEMKSDELDFFEEMDNESLDEKETVIDTLLERQNNFTYVYDFGDNWGHKVTVEEMIDDYKYSYAKVLKYKGETPYEDCGGIYGYYEMQDILSNPKHSQYREIKEWVGAQLTQKYDLEGINEVLSELECEASDVTLKEILTEYSKSDLVEIAKVHHLSGYSKYKKTELVEFLIRELLSKEVMCRYFRFLSEDEIQFLESENTIRKVSFEDMRYAYLLEGGYVGVYADLADSMFCLPKEVKEAYQENCTGDWKKECQDVETFLMYFNVAAELYGICPVEKAAELYKRDTGLEKDEFSIMAFLKDIPENKKCFAMQGSQIVLSLYKEKSEYNRLLQEQQGMDFYIPSKEEIECLGKNGYLPFGKNMEQLKAFFMKEGKEGKEDAELLCRTIQFIIRIGGTMEEILDMLEHALWEYEEMMKNDSMRTRLFHKIENAWKETNTVIKRGNAEKTKMSAETSDDKIILFPRKLPPTK